MKSKLNKINKKVLFILLFIFWGCFLYSQTYQDPFEKPVELKYSADIDFFFYSWEKFVEIQKNLPKKEFKEKYESKLFDKVFPSNEDWVVPEFSIDKIQLIDLNNDKNNEMIMYIDLDINWKDTLMVIFVKKDQKIFFQRFGVLKGGGLGVEDIDNDNIFELLSYSRFGQNVSNVDSFTFPRVYKWNDNHFIKASSEYKGFYKEYIKKLQTEKSKIIEQKSADIGDEKIRQLRLTNFIMAENLANKTIGDRNYIGQKEAIEWVKSKDWELRENALGVLSYFKDDQTQKTIQEMTKDKNEKVSKKAKELLKPSND